ncbi:hypothetical protein ACWGB8_16230 [Kitasatospora sp. NPDC054939]
MRPVGRKVAAVAATGVLLGALAACGSSGSGGSAAKAGEDRAKASAAAGSAPATGAAPAGTPSGEAAPSGAGGGGGNGGGRGGGNGGGGGAGSGGATGASTPQVWQDAPTPVLDYRTVVALMPDQAALPGWEQDKRRVDRADHTGDCAANAAACNGKPLSGEARFTSGDTTARFLVETLPDKAAAQQKLKEVYASFGDSRYRTVELTVIGTESRAWQGNSGGQDGVAFVLRAGTVVATVSTEGGPVDPALTQRLATMLAKRIEQAQAGTTPDTPLGS